MKPNLYNIYNYIDYVYNYIYIIYYIFGASLVWWWQRQVGTTFSGFFDWGLLGLMKSSPNRQVLWGRVKHIPLAKTILVRFHRACCMISKWSAQLFTRVMRQLQLPSESDSCPVKWAVHHLLANISHAASCQVCQTCQKSSPFSLIKVDMEMGQDLLSTYLGELSFTICYLGYQGFDPCP